MVAGGLPHDALIAGRAKHVLPEPADREPVDPAFHQVQHPAPRGHADGLVECFRFRVVGRLLDRSVPGVDVLRVVVPQERHAGETGSEGFQVRFREGVVVLVRAVAVHVRLEVDVVQLPALDLRQHLGAWQQLQ
ncbi:MAG: hypothetical protein WCE68_05135 [Anaerolineales bacterium]